jgi:membrane-bound serine protease (ClpP class)
MANMLPPAAALLLLTLGIALIYVELNRPGSILPGALGLLATLLAIAAIANHHPALPAVILCLTAIALLALDLYRPTHLLVAIAATLALILGFARLFPEFISLWISLPCGTILGAGTSILTRIARRARANKAVN